MTEKLTKGCSRVFLTLLMLAVMTTALTSCDTTDNDEYYSPIHGSWELTAINGMPVYEDEVSVFKFDLNGFGQYGQYSAFPPYNWQWTNIEWALQQTSPNTYYLSIYPDGYQVWSYMLIFNGTNTMMLTDRETGQVLTYQFMY